MKKMECSDCIIRYSNKHLSINNNLIITVSKKTQEMIYGNFCHKKHLKHLRISNKKRWYEFSADNLKKKT